jgi:hypothetical protein
MNGLWLPAFARSLDGLLICVISFQEKKKKKKKGEERFVVRGLLDEIFLFFIFEMQKRKDRVAR